MRLPAVRRQVRPWLIPVGVLLLALVAIWATGGLRTVPATQGRPAAAEQEITLARWVLVIHRVELTNRSSYDTDTPPTVRLYLRATYLGEESTYGLDTGIIAVQTPGGPLPTDTVITDGDRKGAFDPGVAQEMSLAYTWPDAPTVAPAQLRVLIRDEEEKVNYLFADEWGAGPTVDLHVDLPCDDQRVKR